MNRKFVSIPLLVFVLIMITSFTPTYDQQKSTKDYSDDLNQIKISIQTSYNSIATYGADDAFLILRENLYSFGEFANNVQNLDDLAEALGFIATEFDELAQSYANLATLSDDIEQNATVQKANIEKAKDDAFELLSQINADVDQLVSDSSDLETLIQLYPNNMQYPIDLSATKSELNSKRSTQKSFQLATVKIDELYVTIDEFYQSLLLLLYAIDRNEDVYLAASEAIRTKQTLLSLEEGLAELEDLDLLTNDIVDSWDTLNNIVDEIDGLG